MSSYKIFTAKAPVNIAVIKYWGKKNEKLKIPVNDSLSGTLNIDELCATTSAALSSSFVDDELWLNGHKQSLDDESQARKLIEEFRRRSQLDKTTLQHKVHIVSRNNFPTAAGLASSAAGYACLAYVLGHLYGLTDNVELSRLARRGSGSACRSLFGGFVQWVAGECDDNSMALQVADERHWPEMRVLVCVINDQKKDVSSSDGMKLSVQTSSLLKDRASVVVPDRISRMKRAILDKDFDTFADLTMRDSNQFHAICLDTYPPLFYMNDTSRMIIKICSWINAHYGRNMVAYTFDAGPNACIYLLDTFVPIFTRVMLKLFPNSHDTPLTIQGSSIGALTASLEKESDAVIEGLVTAGIQPTVDAIKYIISTSIGAGPVLIAEHLVDDRLEPEYDN